MEDDACYELRKARDAKYRTHLFYLSYDVGKIDDNDITWVAQLSLDRLQMIEPLCRLWEGKPTNKILIDLTLLKKKKNVFKCRTHKSCPVLVRHGSRSVSFVCH
jgi:hypothetical protein